MRAVQATPRVTLRVTSRRQARSRADAPPGAEPNMRLSRAILVMLLLHVVAVGGILAFSLIKERGQSHAAGEPRAQGVEDADAPAIRVESSARANVHTVQPGETLTRIAYAYGVSEEAVRAANGGPAFSPSLRTGQQLQMPDKSLTAPGPRSTNAAANAAMEQIETGHAAPPPATAKSEHAAPDAGATYVVGKGETVYTIAQKLKTTPDALLKLNGIDDPKKLKIGQRLRVPAATKPKIK